MPFLIIWMFVENVNGVHEAEKGVQYAQAGKKYEWGSKGDCCLTRADHNYPTISQESDLSQLKRINPSCCEQNSQSKHKFIEETC